MVDFFYAIVSIGNGLGGFLLALIIGILLARRQKTRRGEKWRV